MNNYYLDQVTNKPVKIGSKAYIKSLKTKISDNYETKTIMNNISYESYLKIKDNLPIYQPKTKSRTHGFNMLNLLRNGII